MLDVVLTQKAILDLGWWIQNDLKQIKKKYSLIENTCNTPFNGLGQPEALKSNYSGYWSRRINLEQMMIYKIEPTQIVIISLKGHYK